ncbi:MAG: hypothetical protein ABSC25_11370 [Roseiarcus sp.]|jgi:hypothetical protein
MGGWAALRKVLAAALSGRDGGATCFGCRHFDNDPAAMEAAFPGLTTFSSGHASVRADDGLCAKHATYLNGRRACAEREPATVAPGEP